MTSVRHRLGRRSAACVLCALLLAFLTSWLPLANATTIYWDGSGTGWNSTTSWSTNSGATTPDPGAVPGIGDDVVFNITTVNTAQTINLNANQAANSLLFRSTGTELLQGGGTNRTLTLGVGGITINSGTGAVTIGSATAGQNVNVLLNGNETWTNNSSNTFTIQNGVSNVGNVTPFTLTVDGTGNTTFNGVISNGGAVGTIALTKAGTGTTILAATNTYTGATTINGGTLTGLSGNTWNNNINSSSALVLGGGTMLLNFANKGNQTFNGLTVNAGASVIATTNGSGGGGNAYTLTLGGVTRNVGGTLNFDETGANGANGSIATTATNTNGILGGYATVNGTTWATVSGGNIIGLAAGSYSTNGFAANANTDITSNQSPAANININSLRFNTASAVTLTLSGTNVIQSGGILETANVGNNASVITGGTLKGASGKDLVVIQNNTSNTLRISSIIADNTSATGFTKSGAGTVILDAANTYTGATRINAGTIQLGNGGTTGSLSTSSTITDNGNLTINRSNAVSQGTDFSGSAISGTGSFTQAGSGTTTLTAANTYTGGTTVSAGTLLVNNTTGSGTGTGTVVVNGSGTTLGGTGTISGAVQIGNTSAGAILNPGANSTTAGTLTTGALTLSGTNANTFHIDAFGTSATDWDKLTSTAAIVLGGTASTLQVNIASGLNFTAGQTYVLLNGTSLTGTFNGINDNDLVTFSGYQFTADYTATGFDLVAVPEPSTWLAAALALGAIGLAQRKRLRACARLITECVSTTAPNNR